MHQIMLNETQPKVQPENKLKKSMRTLIFWIKIKLKN